MDLLLRRLNGESKKAFCNISWGFPSDKESACNVGDRRLEFYLWVGQIPWRMKWQPIPVFLPGESHGQRCLASHSTQGQKESDMTEATEHTISWTLCIQLQNSINGILQVAIQSHEIIQIYRLKSSVGCNAYQEVVRAFVNAFSVIIVFPSCLWKKKSPKLKCQSLYQANVPFLFSSEQGKLCCRPPRRIKHQKMLTLLF